MKKLINTREDAAEALGVSPRTLDRWRVQGSGPAFVKLGKRVGYRDEDLEAFVEESRRRSTSDKAAAV